MRARWSLVVALACVGCTSSEPSREEAAAYFGLADARELVFDVETMGSPTVSARWLFRKSESFADELAFSREQRNQSNLIEETLFFAARLENMVLLRSGDCLPDCTDYLTPPIILPNPIISNTSYTTDTVAVTRSNGNETARVNERHEVQVASEADVFTPAGTFKAHLVSWRTFYPDDAQRPSINRELYFAPDKGFIQFKDGARTYKLKSGVSP